MTPDPISLVAGLNQNFALFRGEDKVLSVDMSASGYDVAAATDIEWWLASSPYAEPEDIDVSKSLTDGIEVSGTTLTIAIDAADTAAMKPNIYYHELKITQSDGAVKVAMTGNLLLRMSINPDGG